MRVANAFSSSSSSVSRSSNSVRALVEEIAVSVEDLSRALSRLVHQPSNGPVDLADRLLAVLAHRLVGSSVILRTIGALLEGTLWSSVSMP